MIVYHNFGAALDLNYQKRYDAIRGYPMFFAEIAVQLMKEGF